VGGYKKIFIYDAENGAKATSATWSPPTWAG
jgi:hypothetical protein